MTYKYKGHLQVIVMSFAKNENGYPNCIIIDNLRKRQTQWNRAFLVQIDYLLFIDKVAHEQKSSFQTTWTIVPVLVFIIIGVW